MKNDNEFLARVSVINYAPMHRLSELGQLLEESGYHVLHLDGAGATDAATLFEEASAQLLEGEPVSNWDSFTDVMRSHITFLDSDQTVLIWTDTQNMLGGRLRDLIVAADVLTGISRELYADQRTFVTFLVGTGPNFE